MAKFHLTTFGKICKILAKNSPFVPPTERPTQFVPPTEAGKAPTKLAITGKSSAPMAIADASTFVIPKQPYTNDKGVCIAELDINNYPEWARRQMAFGRNLKGVEERTTAKCLLNTAR